MNLLAWIEEHQALAAWIQAIGGLMLIGFSVWQTQYVDRRRLDERDRERRAFLELAKQMMSYAIGEFGILYDNWNSKSYVGLAIMAPTVRRKGCDHFRHLAAIPLERWPSVYLFGACQDLLAHMERTVDMAEMFGRSEDPQPLGISRMAWMENYLEDLRAKSQNVDRLINQLLTTRWQQYA